MAVVGFALYLLHCVIKMGDWVDTGGLSQRCESKLVRRGKRICPGCRAIAPDAFAGQYAAGSTFENVTVFLLFPAHSL